MNDYINLASVAKPWSNGLFVECSDAKPWRPTPRPYTLPLPISIPHEFGGPSGYALQPQGSVCRITDPMGCNTGYCIDRMGLLRDPMGSQIGILNGWVP